jgi:hypothetical protein
VGAEVWRHNAGWTAATPVLLLADMAASKVTGGVAAWVARVVQFGEELNLQQRRGHVV